MMSNKIRLKAVGDISFGNLDDRYEGKDAAFPFEHVLPALNDCDVLFGNMESVMRPEDFPMDEHDSGALDSRDVVHKFLKPAKFDILNHATNHVLDCGWVGLLNTRQKILDIGALPIGTGANSEQAHQMQVVEKNGMKLGFIGYQQECNWTLSGGGGRVAYYKMPEILGEVRREAKRVDMLVVSIHADLEFRSAPSVPRVEACRQIAEAGANLILCHHPHVPQGIERWGHSVIAYSLGNFIFEVGNYQAPHKHPFKSTIHSFDIEDGLVTDWEREPFMISKEDFRPTPMTDEERDEAEEYFELIDDIVADPNRLRETWYESCRVYLENTLKRNTPLANGAENFVETAGWRYLGNAESRNWVTGILEMAQNKYEENAYGDFEYVRPNFPFQEKK